MSNPAAGIALLAGGTLLAWTGLADPPGGLSGAVGRVLSGAPAGGGPLNVPHPYQPPASGGTGYVPAADAQAGGGHVWPVASHTITEPYHVPGPWAAGYHTGVDIGAPEGSPVRSPVTGRVVAAGWDGAYGNTVQVRSGRFLVMLAHLSKVAVHAGQDVAAGGYVGNVGATGNATGPHLHVEVRKAPFAYGDDVNPSVVLP